MMFRMVEMLRGGVVMTVVGVTAASLVGCGGQAETSASCAATYTIGFSHPSGQAAFVKTLKEKVEEAGKSNGCVKVLLDNTQGENLESQRATLESWIAQKISAIVVLPVDDASVDGLRQQAQAQGTKWLTYAGKTDGADGSVGFDNDASGTDVAKDAIAWATTAHPAGGITAAITTSPLVGFNGRFAIPDKMLPEAGIDVVSYQQCLDQACGLRIAEDTLREHPNLRVFIGLNDDAALGALRAFTTAGVDPETVYIAGQDGNIDGLEAVKKGGAYRASAAILLNDLAHSIIDTSIAAVTGKGDTNSRTAVELATLRDPARLDELIAQYK